MAKKPKDPGPSQADIAQTEVASASWNDYVARYRPAEAALVKRSEFSAGERSRVRGEVSADAASAFKGLDRKTVSASGQVGQKVGSGSLLADLAGNTEAQGEATGVGKAAATLGGRLQSEAEQFRVTQIGRGIVSGIQSDLSQAARRQTQVSMQKAVLKAEQQNQKMRLAASMAGATARKFESQIKSAFQGDLEEIDMSKLPTKRIDSDPNIQAISPEDYLSTPGAGYNNIFSSGEIFG